MISILLITLASVVFVKCKGPMAKTSMDIEAGFLNPPGSAKPRVWWHWMNGNITKDGIRADLEWMQRVGIGGFQNFDANLRTPQIVEKRLNYMTPEWKDAFRYATKLSDSLGLEMAIAGSPGWSQSGGPWVTPEQAMKKFVWSEIMVEGGNPFNDKLPMPPSSTGRFQNTETVNKMSFYSDAAVIAYRLPENDVPLSELNPKVTSSGGQIDLAALTDNDPGKMTFLPTSHADGKAWIQFEFAKPETFQSVTLSLGGRAGNTYADNSTAGNQILESSDDGIQFKTIMELSRPYYYTQIAQFTATFQPVSARFFRVTFTPPPLKRGRKDISGSKGPGIQVGELVLHTVARVNRFEDKAGFTAASDIYSMATPSVPASDAINRKEVIDLTSKMQPDGTINCTLPAGNWVILRLGYSLIGAVNQPASPEATGLEVDKLSAAHVKAYFKNYLDQYKDATGGLMGKKGLQYIITDSWEMGPQNWTDSMITEFKIRRGYDIHSYLPVLTGHVVESAEVSDRFLWDFRKTIGDLFVENHCDQLTTILHEKGMGRYTESHEGGRAFVADGMEPKRSADIPMSALWVGGFDGFVMREPGVRKSMDIVESASVSHIYGQNLVGAESLTASGNSENAWIWSPETLKPHADLELASGVNRFVIHCSVHQPVDDKIPGLGLGWFGQWFTRHETWAEQAGPWTTYLSRSSFMLQQGQFAADVIYYYGEDNNIVALFHNKLPDVPPGYNYDFTNADALVNVLSVKKGNIVTPSGMNYRVLALDPNSKYMSLPVLHKISNMVKAGAIVIGDKPLSSPSLSDDQAEFQTIANQLWGAGTGENAFGKGKVYAGKTIAEVLASLKIGPDFEYTKPQNTTNMMFVHRKSGDVEIYWVNSRSNNVEKTEASFRVEGKAPEIWHPETGLIEEVSYNITNGRTTVPLRMEPNDAVFVVFRKKAANPSLSIVQPVEAELATVAGPWNVSFQPDHGATTQIVLDELTSWSVNADPGVQYFSGTASYIKTIQAPADWFKDESKIWIDLGMVKNLAEVFVNGKSLGIVWKKPFRVNATEHFKQGDNTLEVKVTNAWVNRLIGDQQPDITKKITYTTQAWYNANSRLLPSGLLGPVKIVRLSK
jgi:hypothetical protein